MFNRKITFAALTVASVLVLFVVSAGYLSLSSLRVEAQEPSKADAGGSKQKDLLKERLAVVREIAKLSTEAYKAGTASYDEVREANHTMFQAELEKNVSEAKKMEEIAGQFSKTGLATNQTALKAKAERLQAEIALEQAKTKAEGQTGLQHNDHVALAEKRVAIKRAAVKIAQAQKTIAVARLGSLKGQVAEAQAAESFAEKQA